MSLSVFTRPYKASKAEDSFTNKEIDDTYKTFSLGKTDGLFNPKLALEHRKQLLIAKLELDKLAKKGQRSISVDPKQQAAQAKKGNKAPEPVKKPPPIPGDRRNIRILSELISNPFN